jgi:hypothetical protein
MPRPARGCRCRVLNRAFALLCRDPCRAGPRPEILFCHAVDRHGLARGAVEHLQRDAVDLLAVAQHGGGVVGRAFVGDVNQAAGIVVDSARWPSCTSPATRERRPRRLGSSCTASPPVEIPGQDIVLAPEFVGERVARPVIQGPAGRVEVLPVERVGRAGLIAMVYAPPAHGAGVPLFMRTELGRARLMGQVDRDSRHHAASRRDPKAPATPT